MVGLTSDEQAYEDWQEQDAAEEERNALDDRTWEQDEIIYLEKGQKP